MNQNDIESLMDNYLQGKTSKEENLIIAQWLEADLNPQSDAWPDMDEANKAQWLASVYDDIHQTIHSTKVTPSKRYLWSRWTAVAATIIVVFSLYWLWPVIHQDIKSSPITQLTVSSSQKKQVILPDGSQVWINSNSVLTYPQSFKGKLREVNLSGEAYFDIKHDIDKPFIVHTGKIVTTVLGTAFNIKEDKSLQTIVVTVTRGKVKVAKGSDQLAILKPNQQVIFNIPDNKAVQAETDSQKAIAWQQTDLLFDDITFEQAALKLEQRFKVKISFENQKIKDCRFSGSVLSYDKLDKILKVICAFNHASYTTKKDGNIVISGQGCN
ncbi:FecR family protein [Pedobacter sp. UYP1]|jgi:transmembrane sensor|uniref:FecR family protein n=1 Tax=Pedobacter sp. UYP1 TaxID=1756396 RepID=UPI0033996EBA